MGRRKFFVFIFVCAAIMFAADARILCETRKESRTGKKYLLRPLDSLSGDELRRELFVRRDEIISNGFYLLKYKTQEEFVKEFGPPIKVESQEVNDWHTPGDKDTRVELFDDLREILRDQAPGDMYTKLELFYDTMRVQLLLKSDENYLSELFLTGEEYELIYGIKIGSSRDYIRKVLGEPYGTRKRGQVWYYTMAEMPHRIYFYFDGDVVKSVEWSFAYYN